MRKIIDEFTGLSRGKRYYRRHREECKAKRRARHQTPEGKEYNRNHKIKWRKEHYEDHKLYERTYNYCYNNSDKIEVGDYIP